MALLTADLIKIMALRTGLSHSDCHAIMKVLTLEVARSLADCGNANVEGLGRFYTTHKGYINIEFRPSKALKDLIIPKEGERSDEIILE